MRLMAQCLPCKALVFTAARQMADGEVEIMENHLRACRPLNPIRHHRDLLRHFKITMTDR